MAIEYRLSDMAKKDYFSIYAYTLASFGEAQAETYTNGLLDCFTMLTEQTKIGRDVSNLRKGYFRYNYKSHAIYYTMESTGVVIIRVLDQRQKQPTKETT